MRFLKSFFHPSELDSEDTKLLVKKIWAGGVMLAFAIAIIVMFLTNRNMEPNTWVMVSEIIGTMAALVWGLINVIKDC